MCWINITKQWSVMSVAILFHPLQLRISHANLPTNELPLHSLLNKRYFRSEFASVIVWKFSI